MEEDGAFSSPARPSAALTSHQLGADDSFEDDRKREQNSRTPGSAYRPRRMRRTSGEGGDADKENSGGTGDAASGASSAAAAQGVTPSKLACIGEVRDEITCCVCLDICTRPVTTTCGHNFCRRCLKASLRADRLRRCPHCRGPLPPGYTPQINTALWNLIRLLFPQESAAAPPTPASPAGATPPRAGRRAVVGPRRLVPLQPRAASRLARSSSSSLNGGGGGLVDPMGALGGVDGGGRHMGAGQLFRGVSAAALDPDAGGGGHAVPSSSSSAATMLLRRSASGDGGGGLPLPGGGGGGTGVGAGPAGVSSLSRGARQVALAMGRPGPSPLVDALRSPGAGAAAAGPTAVRAPPGGRQQLQRQQRGDGDDGEEGGSGDGDGLLDELLERRLATSLVIGGGGGGQRRRVGTRQALATSPTNSASLMHHLRRAGSRAGSRASSSGGGGGGVGSSSSSEGWPVGLGSGQADDPIVIGDVDSEEAMGAPPLVEDLFRSSQNPFARGGRASGGRVPAVAAGQGSSRPAAVGGDSADAAEASQQQQQQQQRGARSRVAGLRRPMARALSGSGRTSE